MNMHRRVMLVGASVATILAGCATTGSGSGTISFATAKTYVADAAATVDKLIPIVTALDPTAGPAISKAQTAVDAAAAAFASVTDPTTGTSAAQNVVTAISDALSVIEAVPGIPPPYLAAIAAAQVLLVTVGTFFSVAPTPTASISLSHPDETRAAWAAAKASPLTPAQADDRVRAFLTAN